MGLFRAAKPICVWLNPNSLKGWWQKPHRAEGHMYILNSSKYANVLCWLKLKQIGFKSNLFWVSWGKLCTWAATRKQCSYRKAVLTFVAEYTGEQQPVPKNPSEDTKPHLFRPPGNEELQRVAISMWQTGPSVCTMAEHQLQAYGLLGRLQGAGSPTMQMRRPMGEYHSSLPAHMYKFPSKEALEDGDVYPGPILACNSDVVTASSQLRIRIVSW